METQTCLPQWPNCSTSPYPQPLTLSAQNIHALGSNNFWSRSFSAADDTRPRGPKGTQGVGLRKRTWNVWKVAKEMRKKWDCYPDGEVQEPKLGCEKKTGSYRDLNQNFGRFPWIWMAATVLLISHYRYLQGTAVHRFWSSIFFSAHRFVRKNGHRFNSTSSDSSYGGRRSTEMWKRWRLCRLGRLGVSSQAPVLKFRDPKTLSKTPGDLLW